MFCDCDDMFLRIDSLYKILEQINQNKYDLIIGARLQDIFRKIEVVDCKQQLTRHEVHAKVYRRQFLIDHNITWKKDITEWGEDFYFNCLILGENPQYWFYNWTDLFIKADVLALKSGNIMAGFNQLDHGFVSVYTCFEKTFAQWWRELDSDLKNWLL